MEQKNCHHHMDLSGKVHNRGAIPEKVSDLENDLGYITERWAEENLSKREIDCGNLSEDWKEPELPEGEGLETYDDSYTYLINEMAKVKEKLAALSESGAAGGLDPEFKERVEGLFETVSSLEEAVRNLQGKTDPEIPVVPENLEENLQSIMMSTQSLEESKLGKSDLTPIQKALDDLSGKVETALQSLTAESLNKEITTLEIPFSEGGYLKSDGDISQDVLVGGLTSDWIDISKYDKVYITGCAKYTTCIFVVRDSQGKKILHYPGTQAGEMVKAVEDYEFEVPVNAKEIRIGSYADRSGEMVIPSLKVIKGKEIPVGEAMDEVVGKVREFENKNPLFGKRWVICGDSFTLSEDGQVKTYPLYIKERNGIEVIIQSSINPLAEADYITLAFGPDEEETEIGQITDGGLSQNGELIEENCGTIYGIYNSVIEWIITNRPWAKVGLIISAYGSEGVHDAKIAVAKRWGIPYLDLKANDQIPCGAWGGPSGLCEKAKELRGAQYRVSETNSLPNSRAHELISIAVEEFLRGL